MSVSMGFFAGKELVADVPVSFQSTFLQYWAPVIKELRLPILAQWDGLCHVRREEAPALLREIQAIASVFRERVPGGEDRDYLLGRTELLISSIEKYLKDERVDLISIG